MLLVREAAKVVQTALNLVPSWLSDSAQIEIKILKASKSPLAGNIEEWHFGDTK